MSLRPITPQSPARIEWEQAVCLAIEHKIECTTSDAQGIMDAQADRVDSLYLLRTVADIAAIKLLQDPAVHPDEPEAPAEPTGLDILNAEGFKLLEVESDSSDASANWPTPDVPKVIEPVRARTWHDTTIETCDGIAFADAYGAKERLRIIDCVNACAGISDPKNVVPMLLRGNETLLTIRGELEQVKRSNVHALGSLGEAREQRDALVAAATMLLDAESPHMTHRNAKEREAYKALRAAVIAAGGSL